MMFVVQRLPKFGKYGLSVVKDFAPEIVIIQLVSNDLMDSSDLKVGFHLEDLVMLLRTRPL